MPRGSGDSDTGRRYGYRQGPQPDDDRRKQYGRWANMGGRSWDWQIGPDGNVQWRARAGNPGRVEAYGSDWFNAPDYVQRGYDRSSAYFGKNPDASFEDFQVQRGLQSQIAQEGLVQDPATGNWYHPQQGAFDPNGYYRDAQGYVGGQGGADPTAPAQPGPDPTEPESPVKSSPSSFSDGFMGSSGFGTGSAPAKSAPAGSSNFQSGFMTGAGVGPGAGTGPVTKKRKPGEPFNPFEV